MFCSTSTFHMWPVLYYVRLWPLEVFILWGAIFISSIIVHNGIFTNLMMMACMFTFIQVISWSVLSVWLFKDNQSIMYSFGPCLYIMYTLYWWMHSMMCCKHWDKVAASILIIATNDLWSVMMHTSLTKQWWWDFFRLCSIQRLLILYCCSIT